MYYYGQKLKPPRERSASLGERRRGPTRSLFSLIFMFS